MTTVFDNFSDGRLAGLQGKVLLQPVGARASSDGTRTVLGAKFAVLVPASGAFTVNVDAGHFQVWREFLGFTDGPHHIVVPASGTVRLRTLMQSTGAPAPPPGSVINLGGVLGARKVTAAEYAALGVNADPAVLYVIV
ncbi:hypothetical protein [Rhodococcoides kyotonense]|uniref:Uncharacterized protein n=1 Tax=Rhodococcoides kyotonense TaxID=398843 RepID=A0A239FNR4_9NOCA|nr:hypothetical protein [Rhodococcus kyotonensis]SNS58497.1 hypothetical protein SAMN05421642_103387 [Rhodococcus kyotonensis]